jgi:hypothetical protein
MALSKPLQGVQYTSAEQIEDVVRQLKDIISARAVVAATGSLQELHVMTTARRSPKLIARDIESALSAHLGLQIDYKKISIAQTRFVRTAGSAHSPNRPASAYGAAGDARLQLSNVTISVHGVRAEATVTLKRNDETFQGSAGGHASSHNQLRLVATATIRAVENGAAEDGTMLVEDVCTHQTVGDRMVVVVVVSVISERGEEILTGSALIRQDMWKAVAAASLDAINRFHASPAAFEEEFI